MIHNDILRRLRFAFAINDGEMIAIFKLANYDIKQPYLHAIMKKEEEANFALCPDSVLSLFLDGLIIKNRGKQEGKEPVTLAIGVKLTNNEILKKLRVALTLRDEDFIDILKLSDFRISKGELSAFYRQKGHRNFKPCGDQFMRNLLQGLVKRYREKQI